MSVNSCFLPTEDTLIFEEQDEAYHNTLEVEFFIELYHNRNMETLL